MNQNRDREKVKGYSEVVKMEQHWNHPEYLRGLASETPAFCESLQIRQES
jgi:hypothetical protein